MVAIEHRQKSSATTITTTTQITDSAVLSPTSSSTSSTASSVVSTTTSSVQHPQQQQPESSEGGKMSTDHSAESAELAKRHQEAAAAAITKSSAVSQRNVDIQIARKSNMDAVTQELTKKVLKLDLTGQDLDDLALKSPKSPITARLPHQTSLTSSVDVEDRKTLREALYQGIFHRHRRTIFAVGSFLRMLRSRNSQYNTIRSSSEGEDVDEVAR